MQKVNLGANITSFTVSNAVVGAYCAVQMFASGASRTIAPGSNIAVIGLHPTGIDSDMTGILAANSYGTTVGSVIIGFSAQTGIG